MNLLRRASTLKIVIVEDNNATVRSLVETIDWQALDCEIAGVALTFTV